MARGNLRTRLSPQEPQQESVLLEYGRVLWRHRWLVSACAIAGAVLGVAVSLPSPLMYQAKTSLDIQGLNENFMNMRAVDPNGLPSSYPAESYLATQIKLIQSESMSTRAANKVKQAGTAEPIEANDKLSSLKRRFGMPVPQPESFETMVDLTAKSVKVRPLGMTRLVEATCESSSASLAANFCNALATEFIAQDLEVRWETAQSTSAYLSRQLQDVRIKLQNSEHQLQRYAQESKLLFSADKEGVAQDKLRQLQAELSRAQADRVAKQAQYNMILSAEADKVAPVLDSGPLRQYQMRLSELRSQYAELAASFTRDYPKVKRIEAQIKEIEGSVEKERLNIVDLARNDHAAARQREALLVSAYNVQENLVSSLVPKATEYNMLLREVESGRQLYETLLQRVKEVGFMSAMRTSPVRVVDVAGKPTVPSSPTRKKSAGAGLALGSLAGIALAFWVQRSDRRLRRPGDAHTYLHVRELGVIPSARFRDFLPAPVSWFPALARRYASTPFALTTIPQNGGTASLDLVTWNHKNSLLADTYRSVMSSLLFGDGGRGRSDVRIAVSSPSIGEGKSTLSSNLAIALAQTSRRVILIDGDLRKPRLHQIFDVENDFGFSDVLRGEIDIKNCPIAMLAQPTLVPNLFLLPSGRPTDDASSAMFSPLIEGLLERLTREFGTVIIDTPPMLHLADARILARYTDGVVLVFRAGKTTREAAEIAQEIFAGDQTPILGTVLNDFNPEQEGSQGYYDSYYQYQKQTTA